MRHKHYTYSCNVCGQLRDKEDVHAIRVSNRGIMLDDFFVDLPEHEGTIHFCKDSCHSKLKTFFQGLLNENG